MRLTLTDRVAAGGDIIGHLDDGRVVFVGGALPGETVDAEVVETKRDYARADTVDVVDAHPGRVVPPCPELARGCGGCQLQHADVPTQRALKEAVVADALRRIGRLPQPPVLSTVGLADEGYRTTVHLAVDRTGRPCYRPRRSHAGVAVDSCLVAHPRLEELIVGSRLPGARRVTLRVGVAGGDQVVLADRPRSANPGHIHEEAGGRRWRVSARAFFQAGPKAADALAEAVDVAVGETGGPVVDLYAGVGLLGGVVAARRRIRLVAVEQDPIASADARHNLADLDARVVTAEVGGWKPRPADVVIADPARTGLGRPGVAAVEATGAARLVLVSCDPASLGRDVALLAASGWGMEGATLVDAFPHTSHVEVVSRFTRR